MADVTTFVSPAKQKAATCGITFFPHCRETIPSDIERDLHPLQIIARIADEDGPVLTDDKERMVYFVPTSLHPAPLTGKTALRFAPGTVGPMRSAGHVDWSCWIAFDLDGLTDEHWAGIKARLTAGGVLFLAFSTWSFGLPEKPGIRVRLILFFDRLLDPATWARCWQSVNVNFLGGLVDPATGKLSQQAGVWGTAPGRQGLAFRHVSGARLLSAEALLSAAPAPAKPRPLPTSRVWTPGIDREAKVRQVEQALGLLSADQYGDWIKGLAGLKSLVARGDLSEKTACRLWMDWSESATTDAKARNDDSRYRPQALWDRWAPSAAPPEGLIGALFASARESARQAVETDMRVGRLGPRGVQAAQYLAKFHPKAFESLRAV